MTERTLSPAEWEELKALLATNTPGNEILAVMSRGRGIEFIRECAESLGVDLRKRGLDLNLITRFKKHYSTYLTYKAQVDHDIEQMQTISYLMERYGFTRKFVKHLLTDLGIDLDQYIRSVCNRARRKNAKVERLVERKESPIVIEDRETLSKDRRSLSLLACRWTAQEVQRICT